MKILVKKIARHAATVPGLGRLVQIAIAIVRLPELRVEVVGLASGSYQQGPKGQPALWREVNALRENTSGDANLAHSVPVALRRLTREVHALRQRLDETGVGMEASLPPHGGQASRLVVAPAHASAVGLKLHLGHNGPAPAGHVSASLEDIPGAVPLEPGTAAEIQVAYLFETFSQAELREHVLPHLRACLQTGGRLRVLYADAGAALAAYAQGECAYDELREALFGGAQADSPLQLNMLSPSSLATLLGEAGFTVSHAADTGMRDGRRHTFETVAEKSSSDSSVP
ncbi:hypothetical protein ACSUZJ_04945 [Telluria sp. B2]